jgi:uncharacterized protein (DUF952 family)
MKIHHLALADDWYQACREGRYAVSTRGLGLDEVGFVHCARPEQVAGVHERFYADVTEPLVLLTIDTDLLTSPWQLAQVPGEALTFPHVHGPIDLGAVVAVTPFRG